MCIRDSPSIPYFAANVSLSGGKVGRPPPSIFVDHDKPRRLWYTEHKERMSVMGAKAERAKTLFQQGYNCAQSVAVAFAPEMGLSEETAARLASAFGGGMGRMREVCGAVSGMLLRCV